LATSEASNASALSLSAGTPLFRHMVPGEKLWHAD
jgi:hypothetical protein